MENPPTNRNLIYSSAFVDMKKAPRSKKVYAYKSNKTIIRLHITKV